MPHVNVYLSGNPVHDRVLRAFAQGVPGGCSIVHAACDEVPIGDIGVVFGVFKKGVPVSWRRGKIMDAHRERDLPVVVLETGYINRGDGPDNHYAVGLNGLNGRADFRNRGMPDDRWRALDIEMKPLHQGDKIVLCGQIPWDASVQHVNIHEWYEVAIDQIRQYTDRPIVFRPHPLLKHVTRIDAVLMSNNPLRYDLMDAWAVVTFNSNTAVEAAIDGVPVFAFDEGSMALPVANTDFADIEKPRLLPREQWAADLAYAQWMPYEIAKGWTWKHLFGDR
jgi:hypothetical protein